MPGISAIFKKTGSIPIAADFCAKIRNEMLHFPFYSSRQIIAEDSVNIGFTGYDEYPITMINNPDYHVIFEGRVYNQKKSALENTLRQIAAAQVGSGAIFNKELKRFSARS